jgi:serine/threonine protein kinase
VIALTDGNLWFLEHKVFKRLVMRSIDNSKLMQRLLRKVQLFSCFGMDQIRVIVKLLTEEKFLAGEYITREGQRDENFYIIVKGECEYSSREQLAEGEGEEKEGEEASPPRGGSGSGSGSATLAGGTKSTYLVLKKDDHFGERSLLSDRTVSAYSVLAKTDVKVLYVGAKDFENHLGRFSEKVESYKVARDADILSRVSAPSSLSDLTALGLVSSDDVGSVLIGSFGLPPCAVTVRSYLLSKVEQRKASSAILNSIEAFRVIKSSSQKNCFVFRLLSFCHDRNALHLILDLPVVADLDSLLTSGNPSGSIRTTEEVVIYVATCIFSGLEFLHSLGIIFRCVQPETMYVDVHGRLILGSFRVSKVGTVGGRTYTITGTTEYLAPEQVSRQGHSSSVDLWSLGVVLYELATGVHPFAAEGDTAFTTYSKISSYGTRAFPRLFYPEEISKELIALIEKLLVPVPEMRLGAGLRGYDAVKEIFNNLDWEDIKSHPPLSPLAASAAVVREDMLLMGVESALLDAFFEDYSGTDQWQKTVEL